MGRSEKKGDSSQDSTRQDSPEYEHAGRYLQKLRSEKGLTIQEVSHSTRISVVNLNAIESHNFQALPADTFTRGLLTIYARFLGIDPAMIVPKFMEERHAGKTGGKRFKPKQPGKILTPKTLAEPPHVSSLMTALILLIVIIAIFTAFCLYTSWNPFSFLTDRESPIQTLMMSVLQGSEQEKHSAIRDNEGGTVEMQQFMANQFDEDQIFPPLPAETMDLSPGVHDQADSSAQPGNGNAIGLVQSQAEVAAHIMPEDLQGLRGDE